MIWRRVVVCLRRRSICLVTGTLLLSAATTTFVAAGTISGVPAVVDGDGLRIGKVAVRMHGLNLIRGIGYGRR